MYMFIYIDIHTHIHTDRHIYMCILVELKFQGDVYAIFSTAVPVAAVVVALGRAVTCRHPGRHVQASWTSRAGILDVTCSSATGACLLVLWRPELFLLLI
jgi:hypothetical protein